MLVSGEAVLLLRGIFLKIKVVDRRMVIPILVQRTCYVVNVEDYYVNYLCNPRNYFSTGVLNSITAPPIICFSSLVPRFAKEVCVVIPEVDIFFESIPFAIR